MSMAVCSWCTNVGDLTLAIDGRLTQVDQRCWNPQDRCGESQESCGPDPCRLEVLWMLEDNVDVLN